MRAAKPISQPVTQDSVDSVLLAFPNPVKVLGAVPEPFSEILQPAALRFLSEMSRIFEPIRQELLKQRKEPREFGFLPETKEIRESKWQVAEIPKELDDRRVEITGPVERKMMINALNSGAQVFMADFEDSHSPTWNATMDGQLNLRDAVQKRLEFTSPEGKHYHLNDQTALLMVRPRGWHLPEKHVEVAGVPISASLFDFGLFFFHNAKEQLSRGTRPYFYLPKIESYLEARLWNDVFNFAQDYLKIPRGTIKATVLIETFPAIFETEEILYELREHSAGLNCGRWDYIFSFIKKHSTQSEFVTPDRTSLRMTLPFLRAYSRQVIESSHRRHAPALGGMAAQIPIKEDPSANQLALEMVLGDKIREFADGCDGTWVAHPGLVQTAYSVFNESRIGAWRSLAIPLLRDESVITRDLLKIPQGQITEAGARTNLRVAIIYLESWLRGQGCVPIDHLMEDAATAEISRSQLWQWLKFGQLTEARCRELMTEEVQKIREEMPALTQLKAAQDLIWEMSMAPEIPDFLTSIAYDQLT